MQFYILPKKVPSKKLGNTNIVRNDVCGFFDDIDLTEEDYNFYIDEMIDVFERNKVQFHNGIMLAEIMRNVDFNTFEYYKKDKNYLKDISLRRSLT